jgi:hypothetical protein
MENIATRAAKLLNSQRKNPGRKPMLSICPKCGATISRHSSLYGCDNPRHIYRAKNSCKNSINSNLPVENVVDVTK